MKKILLVIPSIASAGGVEKLVFSLSQLLRDRYDVSIACFDPPGTQPYFKSSVPFFALGNGSRPALFFRIFTYLNARRRLSALKRTLRIDLSISVLWRADLINMLSRGHEKIISLSVINIVGNQTNALLLKLHKPVSYVYQRFDRILAIAPSIAAEVQSLYRLNPEKVGIFKVFLARPNSQAFYSDCRRRFVFCARAVQEKNVDGLLHIYAQYAVRNPSHQLVVIGDGPLLNDMKSLARELGLTVGVQADSDKQVLFVGSTVSPETFMLGARAFLLTSRHEGVPTVAILAAALGLPILAADANGGGIRALFNLSADEPLPLPEDEDSSLAGLILPIPEPTSPDIIKCWVSAMELVDLNERQYEKWVLGAYKLAAAHSPEAVRQDWITTIDLVLS